MPPHADSYVDRSTQTVIAGLAKHPAVIPPVLTNNTPPPEDMPAKLEQELTTESQAPADPSMVPTILLNRKKRPTFDTRISMPTSALDAEGPRSPPPTDALMSPLPPANKLHAGHTPVFPRSLSPLGDRDNEEEEEVDDDPVADADMDSALAGPLTLPPKPGDGTEDTIGLQVLDTELQKIARERGTTPEPIETQADSSQPVAEAARHPGSESTQERRRSSVEEVEVVDGVRLKKPKMNLGAPLGQV